MESLKRAETVLGSQAALARAIGLSQQTVNNWMRRGNVPAEYCPAIEAATGGAVRCEELRPDVEWSVVRATACDCNQQGEAA